MRTIRVYVDHVLEPGRTIELESRAAHHVIRVLRRRAGDSLVLFDGRGSEAQATIEQAHRRHGLSARIDSVASVDRESPLSLELLPAVAKGEKLDLVIQKSTELGVASIRPIVTARSEIRLEDARRRLERWREIAVNACEQCGRTMLPAIHMPVAIDNLACSAEHRIVLVPGASTAVSELDRTERGLAVALGPEGGLDSNDLETLASMKFRAIGFGPRVLRTETAAIAIVAALQHRFGDL